MTNWCVVIRRVGGSVVGGSLTGGTWHYSVGKMRQDGVMEVHFEPVNTTPEVQRFMAETAVAALNAQNSPPTN